MSTPAAEDPDPDINTPQGREEVARRTRLRWEEIAPFDSETGERAPMSDWFRDSPGARRMGTLTADGSDAPPAGLVEMVRRARDLDAQG